MSLVVVLRLSGKRTLAKMNAFDLVVTVVSGSLRGLASTQRREPGASRGPTDDAGQPCMCITVTNENQTHARVGCVVAAACGSR